MATHSNAVAWKIPWTKVPGRLQSMASKEWDTIERLHFHFHYLRLNLIGFSWRKGWVFSRFRNIA